MGAQISPDDRYRVPAGEASAKITVKGSKFICYIFPAENKEKAEEIYARIQKKFYDATHHCFAYRISQDVFRYSDDGEPSGTAGKPILQVLEGAELFEVLSVVIRYFGGTKLGTGGLIRAYSEATREALQKLTVTEKIRSRTLTLQLDYGLENLLYHYLERWAGKLIHSVYDKKVLAEIRLPQSNVAPFLKQIKEQSAGKITEFSHEKSA
jgi:uncharacterized YigZ family protein